MKELCLHLWSKWWSPHKSLNQKILNESATKIPTTINQTQLSSTVCYTYSLKRSKPYVMTSSSVVGCNIGYAYRTVLSYQIMIHWFHYLRKFCICESTPVLTLARATVHYEPCQCMQHAFKPSLTIKEKFIQLWLSTDLPENIDRESFWMVVCLEDWGYSTGNRFTTRNNPQSMEISGALSAHDIPRRMVDVRTVIF